MQAQPILSGVPIIESPFFSDFIASGYFDDNQESLAKDLNLYGFALLPGLFKDITRQRQHIQSDLQPLFDQCKQSGENPKQGIFTNKETKRLFSQINKLFLSASRNAN